MEPADSPGSPLNRLSFLRTDHNFLSAAYRHPSARFVLLRELAPLARDAQTLSFAGLADVEPLTGPDPFSKSEEQLLADYDSSESAPQLVFLGINEASGEGLAWKRYTGAPHFALDVTPKGAAAERAGAVIAEMERRGLRFLEGRTHMSFRASDGAVTSPAARVLC